MPFKGTVNNPDGAPQLVEITDEIKEKCASLYGLGLTQELVAESIGVSLATLKRYMTDNPELKSEMFKRLGMARENLASKFWKKLLSPDCPPNIFLFGVKTFLKLDDKPVPPEININLGSTDLILESMKVAKRPEGDEDEIETDNPRASDHKQLVIESDTSKV